MRIAFLKIEHFRGVALAELKFEGHALLVGTNSAGKSTVCEALDLALGPERTSRRPVIDEHDFYASKYVGGDHDRVRIEVILTDLSREARRRFRSHLRPWDAELNAYSDLVESPDLDGSDVTEAAETESSRTAELPTDPEDDAAVWALPVLFLGRYNQPDDDFEGATFFAHPEPITSAPVDDFEELGAGLARFSRADKQYCGFLYLRPNRTGSRALSLQRGSLVDTIMRLEATASSSVWEDIISKATAADLTDDGSGLATVRDELQRRMARFISLGSSSAPVDILMTDLTREHLRETLRLHVAGQPSSHAVPFDRLSTGTLNLMVFALLTYIAELRGHQHVIFAMEEPEIALPPHAQRRLVDFVMRNMTQVIVTSHSPYVIERFQPRQVMALSRDSGGVLAATRVTLPADTKAKKYTDNKRQFAEALLANAVIVVEGATEWNLLPRIADAMDVDETVSYYHPDMAGISFFDAQNDVSVPTFAPIFAGLNKPVYGIHDQPKKPLGPDLVAMSRAFDLYLEVPYTGVEELLAAEVAIPAQRRFLADAEQRDDYPSACGTLDASAGDSIVRTQLKDVLKGRKGHSGYAAALISHCSDVSELPRTLVEFLLAVDADLRMKGLIPADAGKAAASGT
ncbi:ATP-dependent nuclease [Blastococcus tunisiensis]|uniref:Putative ATP-dependent endonuclease of the OLD family n=1 Tax=Blastococcus tunisiensis TaxID=1798228 RepID=A0A1I2HZZ5_9ACTN|nr:AAA family ATPase [Blastococcus sp. DSM 46838]SFF35008.1 putative ATP-dependent endonuclease of the OLD family [Blastococcus sp. DSM 46838]